MSLINHLLVGVWFAEHERQLSDFEKFENATRGLTGSAMLLWKLRGKSVAFLSPRIENVDLT